jgi:hypothetical protein
MNSEDKDTKMIICAVGEMISQKISPVTGQDGIGDIDIVESL